MPKPKKKGPRRGRRAPAKGKRVARTRRPKPKTKKPKAKAAKRPARKGRVAPKKKARAARKPAASKPAAKAVRLKPAAPTPTPVKRKEEMRMAGQNCPIHNSPDCYKPALDAHVQKAYDGYCTKIDWPYWRILPKGWKPK